MDQHFNQATACETIERIVAERAAQGSKDLQLAIYQLAEGAGSTAMPIFVDRPRMWKLSKPIDADGTHEEIVLRIQGIICQRNLPPITNLYRIDPKQRRYMRQSVMLTAFGGASLQACNDNVLSIHRAFSQLLPSSSMDDWVPAQYDEHAAIEMGNRYFTDRNNKANHEAVSFQQSVDPEGILQDAMGADFVHLEENEVVYFQLTADSTNKYTVIDPAKIRAGDVVEAQVSFVAVPLKGGRHKLLIVLRALTLLSCQPLKDAELARAIHNLAKVRQPVRLKRRIGYADDEDEETRAKMARIAL